MTTQPSLSQVHSLQARIAELETENQQLRQSERHHQQLEAKDHVAQDGSRLLTIATAIKCQAEDSALRGSEWERTQRLTTIASLANRLLRASDYTTVLPEVLRILGETAGSDRTSLVKNVPEPQTGKAAVQLHSQWCRTEIPTSTEGIPELESALLWEYFPNFETRLAQGETMYVRVSDVADPARSLIQALGNVSILMVPIIVKDQFWGVFSFDYCHKAAPLGEADQAIFTIAADSISAAIERQAKNEAIRESEARFQTLFELSSEGIYYAEADPPCPTSLPVEEQCEWLYKNFRVAKANRAFAAMYGVDEPGELIGLTNADAHVKGSEQNAELVPSLVKNNYRVFNAETEEVDRFGKPRYFLNNGIGIVEDGYVIGCWATQTDITELRQTQQAWLEAEQARAQELEQLNVELRQTIDCLVKSEKLYRTLLELSNEGIYRFEFTQPVSTLLSPAEQVRLVYQHWRLAEANQTYANHYGVGSPNNLIGMSMPAYDLDSEKSKAANRAIIENGYRLKNVEAEENINGQQRRFLHNVVCDVRDGYLWGGWGTQTDITELHQIRDDLEEERLQAENALIRERTRIAQEIHDTLAQTFTGITVQLKLAQYLVRQAPASNEDSDIDQVKDILNRLGDLAQTGLAEARRSVWAVYPVENAEIALSQRIACHVEQATANISLDAQIIVTGNPQPLSYLISRNLLRVCQEATTNVLKHANATTLKISLSYQPHQLSLHICDNGCGFEPQAISEGFGLVSMSERIDQINGRLRITTQLGEGTKIVVEVSL